MRRWRSRQSGSPCPCAYGKTIRVVSYSLITISAMLAIGTLTRFSGIDATLGLAFADAGVL
jgi:lactate permease